MFVRDTLTGYIHDVPEHLYGAGLDDAPEPIGEGQVVFDGLGNPVGFLPAIPAIASALAPLAAKALPMIGNLVQKAIPMVGNIAQQLPGIAQGLLNAGAPQPALPAGMPAGLPVPMPAPGMFAPFRPPPPAGWVRPPLPYTGLGPRRLYMRCAVWPGPNNMVPAHAATMQPGMPGMPGTVAPQQAASQNVIVQPAPRGHARRRR